MLTNLDSYGPSARNALRHLAESMTHEQLIEEVINSAWRSLAAKLRSQARLSNEADQLTFWDVKISLPDRIRFIDESGDEDFVDRDLATFRQITDNEEWAYREAIRVVTIRERRIGALQKWRDEQTEFDDDAPWGPQVYRDVQCMYCDGGWREGDPFELAHETAVAAGGGDQTVRLAHRSCNRAEGRG